MWSGLERRAMARMIEREAHSYRADPAVPPFDDTRPIVFMDGECLLCTQGARLISRFDRRGEFRIASTHSPLGTAMLAHYGMEVDDPESWLFLDEGRACGSLQAVTGIGRRLGGPARMLGVFRFLPRSVQDWIYRRVARNRRAFGRSDMCALPDPALQSRILR